MWLQSSLFALLFLGLALRVMSRVSPDSAVFLRRCEQQVASLGDSRVTSKPMTRRHAYAPHTELRAAETYFCGAVVDE